MTSHDRANAIGEFHSARLAGDRLVNKQYEPVDIAELTGEVLQGHSDVLNVDWRWDHGRLGCHDPATSLHIATFESEPTRADSERARANTAETQLRELEQRLQQQGSRHGATLAVPRKRTLRPVGCQSATDDTPFDRSVWPRPPLSGTSPTPHRC